MNPDPRIVFKVEDWLRLKYNGNNMSSAIAITIGKSWQHVYIFVSENAKEESFKL